MNELQIALLTLGGLAAAGIFTYGKWQEQKHRKRAEQLFKPPEEDVLLEERPRPAPPEHGREAPREVRTERRTKRGTGRGKTPRKEARREGPPAERREPTLFTALDHAPEAPPFDKGERIPETRTEVSARAGPDTPVPRDLLSSGVDAIVALDLVEPVGGEAVMSAQRDILAQIEKPVLWVGLDEEEGVWELAREKGAYRHWRVGLQLVDRAGPLGGNDFLLFSRAMQRLAGELMTVAKDMPSSQQVLEQAQQLDRFCADMDIQIGINLASRDAPFPGTKIRALAESAGMVLGDDGLYVRHDDAGRVLFAFSNAESGHGFVAETIKGVSTRRLVFLLDVPRAPQGMSAYRQMLTIARGFAKTLNGALEDDNRHPLSDAGLEHIGAEFIARTQATLEAAGLKPGDPLALRIFN
ncbi:MAG: cell division protein FtsZ [Zoogloeaceae bacterium]|nr:cell division protein FtsZ [Zoogloeaceae bacterium]